MRPLQYIGTILKCAVENRGWRIATGQTVLRYAMTLGITFAMAAGFPAAVAAQKSASVAPIYVTPQAMIDSTRQIAKGVSNAVNDRLAPGSPLTSNGQVLPYTGEDIADPAADAFSIERLVPTT